MKIGDTMLSHRPELLVAKTIAYNGKDITFAPYGDYWRQMRKICTLEILRTRRFRSNYPLMYEEISRLVKTIKESSAKGTPIDVYECFNSITCAIICRASIGKACKDQDSLISTINKITLLVGHFNISDLFPSLGFLNRFITGSNQKLPKMHHELFDHLLEEIVTEHEESIRKNNVDEEDLLHLFLKLRENESHNFHTHITRDNIKAIILDRGNATYASHLLFEIAGVSRHLVKDIVTHVWRASDWQRRRCCPSTDQVVPPGSIVCSGIALFVSYASDLAGLGTGAGSVYDRYKDKRKITHREGIGSDSEEEQNQLISQEVASIEEIKSLKQQMTEMYQAWSNGQAPPSSIPRLSTSNNPNSDPT
ncbi:putative beta-amylase 8-like [Capsicum annuum]|nr:putative beta-amylase 8-like [Capsicum annuum]